MSEEEFNISVRAFAREVNRSHVWVLKLLKAGRLPRNDDGTIPLKQGLEAFKLMKEEQAEQEAAKAEKKTAGTKKKAKAPKTEQSVQPAPKVDIDPAGQTNINVALNKAKLAEKTYQARLKELEYKLKSGEILEKAEVAAEAEWLAGQVKQKLLSIPPRISSMCEGRLARDIEEIIADAINDALKELQKLKYTGA